ncbi:MAG: hypothetical protein JSW11_20665 [Candidatus Heimdallarchaeota archaeon]|nr:MAG: hypothetical protein JSW11_20665 [Candidatus Heimdallarchaeota archaeon]
MTSDLEMHVLAVFGLVVNLVARFIGAIVSFDMYTKTKEKRHFLQLIGWFFLFVSGLLPFGITLTQDLSVVSLIRISDVITLNIGLYLLITGLSLYFVTYPRNLVGGGLGIIIIVPILVFILLDVVIAINVSVFFQFVIILIFLALVYSNRKEIKIILQYSYGLIVLLTTFLVGYIIAYVYVITRVPNYSYGLYMSTDVIGIMAYYSAVAMVTLLGLMVFLHLEQGIFFKKKNILTDDYSHKIGNILQIIMGAGTTIKELSDSNEVNTTTDLILERSEEAGELIKKIREMD